MKTMLKTEEEVNNVVELRLATNSKEPPEGETWLDRLPEGSVFLIKDIRNPLEYSLGLFMKLGRYGKASILQSPNIPGKLYMDTVAFCQKYRCFEQIELTSEETDALLIKEEQEKGGNDDGDRVPVEPGTPGT